MEQVETTLTADGYVAATAGTTAYMMKPSIDRFRVMAAYGKADVVQSLKAKDFTPELDFVNDEGEFKAIVAEMREHERQLEALGRYAVDSSTRTPWGKAQQAIVYAPDNIVFYETAGHGGFKVYAKLNRTIPEPYRNEDGWYEEDSEAAKMVVSLPQYFTDRERRLALETVINAYPDAYEAVTGEIIPEGESYRKDARLFAERNVDNWVVISALEDDNGMVHCCATKGGKRGGWNGRETVEVEEAQFLVPVEEYRKRSPHGFVIDPERHERLDAPATMAP